MKKLSVEEKYQIMLKCRESGMSERKWCLKNNINMSTYRMWVTEVKKDRLELCHNYHN